LLAGEVLAERLANQRLTGPLAERPVQVVRELLAVQAQDAPVARAMIALRSGTTQAEVLRAVAAGELVRTHVLRPTWHYVAAADLRWLLAATSAKVEAGMASRHRQLSLDAADIEAGLAVIENLLTGRNFANRTEIGAALITSQVVSADALQGQRVGHLLLIAELRALICSAPLISAEHRYALTDEVLPPRPPPPPPPALPGRPHPTSTRGDRRTGHPVLRRPRPSGAFRPEPLGRHHRERSPDGAADIRLGRNTGRRAPAVALADATAADPPHRRLTTVDLR
jgi:hypothetical protein